MIDVVRIEVPQVPTPSLAEQLQVERFLPRHERFRACSGC